MTPLREALLERILSQPSSPYRERHVISAITSALDEGGVPYFIDPVGNIVLGAKNRAEYLKRISKKNQEPLRLFVAHMDHPGFHGVKWQEDGALQAKWYGGSPTNHLEGAKVWLADASGWLGEGRMRSAALIPSGRAIDSAMIDVPSELRARIKDPGKIYGGFGFRAPVWREDHLIYTKAADDLVGSFAIISLALDLYGKKKGGKSGEQPFLGLLTRAEEVGFIGAIGHLELGWMKKAKRAIIAISLETSRTLPGAEIGKGPVVRLGDRSTVFNSSALQVFTELAKTVLPEKHQKRIMDGGTCEATAMTAYGFSCVGISVPLGNYHNQSFEGGPDSRGPLGPAPEFVHLDDVQGLLQLCHGLLKPKLPWTRPWEKKLQEFKRDYKKAHSLLRSGP